MSTDNSDQSSASNDSPLPRSDDSSRQEALILVRGETVQDPKSTPRPENSQLKASDREPPGPTTTSQAPSESERQVPPIDHPDVGVQKEQRVIRDGKADLAFTGTLVAWAAPTIAPKGHWDEYRVYETSGGKHVFSKVAHNLDAEDDVRHEAEVFDPAPSSVPSQLLRGARELTRSKPLNWTDAAVDFFGYDPLAKELYRKFGGQFDEHIK